MVKVRLVIQKNYAKNNNAHLKDYDLQKKNYGIFIVDFADQELAHKIYSTN